MATTASVESMTREPPEGSGDVAAVHQLDFFFDAVLVKRGGSGLRRVRPCFLVRGGGELDEVLHALGDVLRINDDFLDVGGIDIADGAG